jgi:hypothetical protein
MLRIPVQIEYKNLNDGQVKTRRVVPLPSGSEKFNTGNTCITGYDASANNGKGGIRRFDNDNILRIRSCAFPVKIPKEHQKYFNTTAAL